MTGIDRFAEQARETLDREIWEYLERGADDGVSAAAAASAWQRLQLRPHILSGVAAAKVATTILGQSVDLPVMIAPTGRATRYHPDGELALLEAAVAAGCIVVLPSSVVGSLGSLRERQPKAKLWQQLYFDENRGAMRERLHAACEAGCLAIVLTADLLADGRAAPPAPVAAWEANRVAPGAARPFTAATVEDLAWLCTEAELPVIVKGVLRGDDAELCLAAGAAGLIVSNHGGNQLDTAIPSADALGEVVDACEGKAEIYLDGGIRRGTSILKALALGARAVLVGRPASYGLAAAGAAGVQEVLAILAAELKRAMALCGAADLAAIDRSLVRPAPPSA